MTRTMAVLGSALFFLAGPGVTVGLVPWIMTRWVVGSPFLGLAPMRFAGIAFIVGGLAGLLDCFARFALQGLGTPAPPAPARLLVAAGLYRHVRKPMYLSAVAIIVGQAVLFGDVGLIAYGALFALACHLFVVAYEEPTLSRTFGKAYDVLRSNVPRWIPRLRPWSPS
jgi:protein-S-isoprenylcysteine O-methyltransferase Ste14